MGNSISIRAQNHANEKLLEMPSDQGGYIKIYNTHRVVLRTRSNGMEEKWKLYPAQMVAGKRKIRNRAQNRLLTASTTAMSKVEPTVSDIVWSRTWHEDRIISVNAHVIKYIASNHVIRSLRGSLVDRGANGGIIGNDTRIRRRYPRSVDVTGIDNHEMTGLAIVDASSRVMTNRGPVVAIWMQYAYHGLHRTIHSTAQLEHYKNIVDDRSIVVGGKQCITTIGGYIMPMDVINGLVYLKMVPDTDYDWENLPHVIMTSGHPWNPTVLDYSLSQTKKFG